MLTFFALWLLVSFGAALGMGRFMRAGRGQ